MNLFIRHPRPWTVYVAKTDDLPEFQKLYTEIIDANGEHFNLFRVCDWESIDNMEEEDLRLICEAVNAYEGAREHGK